MEISNVCQRLLNLNLVPSVWSPLTGRIKESSKEREVRHKSVQNEGESSCVRCRKKERVCGMRKKEREREKETLV